MTHQSGSNLLQLDAPYMTQYLTIHKNTFSTDMFNAHALSTSLLPADGSLCFFLIVSEATCSGCGQGQHQHRKALDRECSEPTDHLHFFYNIQRCLLQSSGVFYKNSDSACSGPFVSTSSTKPRTDSAHFPCVLQ